MSKVSGDPLRRWREALAAWALPTSIPGARDQRPPPRRVPHSDPTAEDAFQALRALGLDAHLEAWVDRLGFGHYDDFDELVQRTRQRLLLPPGRSSEVATALLDLGVDPRAPRFPGTVGRRLATIWWHGTVAGTA